MQDLYSYSFKKIEMIENGMKRYPYRRKALAWCFAVVVLIPYFSCFAQPPAVEKTPAIAVTVQKHDVLIRICRRFLADPSQWPKVAKFNRLSEPDKIRPGQTIWVPNELLRGIPLEGRVSYVRGDVSLFSPDRQSWGPLASDLILQEGQKIRTGVDGSLEVQYDDGATLYLRPDTQVTITSAIERIDNQTIRSFFLKVGKVVSTIRNATGKEQRFELKTPSTTGAARGTWFRMAVDQESASRCEVLGGTVEVAGAIEQVLVEQGMGTVVTSAGTPSPPTRLLPPPSCPDVRPTYKQLPVAIRFSPPPGAISINGMITEDPDGKVLVKQLFFPADEKMVLDDLEEGTYFLHASSIDRFGLEGPVSEPLEFRVRTNPPPPFLQSPRAGAVHPGRNIEFRWLKVPSAKMYQLQVATDSGFEKIVCETDGLPEISHQVDFQNDGIYFYRVRSIAADGFESLWSPPLSFEIVRPPSVAMEKPDIQEKTIYIRWQTEGGAASYVFQMATTPDFKEILKQETVTEPFIEMEMLPPGEYFVRTQGVSAEGFYGPYSQTQVFIIHKDIGHWIVGGFLSLVFIFTVLL